MAAKSPRSGHRTRPRPGVADADARLGAEVVRRETAEEDAKVLADALRASELWFRTLADTTSAAILLYDTEDRVIYANPAASEISGYSREELSTKRLWDLIDPVFHEQIYARRRARAEGQEATRRAVMQIVRRDGERRWVDYNAGFVDIDGRTIAIGTAFDITEQRRAEDAIRVERDFSAAIINSLPGVFYLYDQSLRFLRWNRNFEQVLGYSAEEVAGLTPLDLFAGDDRDRVAARIEEVFTTGSSDVEAEIVTKRGERLPYYFTGLATRLEGKLCLLGTGIDIRARRRAEEALLETQRRLEEAQARARLGSWEIFPDTEKSFWSKEMYRLYDRDPELGPPSFAEFRELTHPDDRARVTAAYEEALRSQRPATIEIRALTRSGEVRHLSGTFECIHDGEGRLQRLAGTLLDVTERKRAEEEQARLQNELRRSEIMAAMGALVGGVAHEVRNPLFGMTATVDAMQARFGDSEELPKYLEVLRGELHRLSELMRDLLEYGRPYRHAFALEPLDEVIDAAMRACAAEARERRVELSFRGRPTALLLPMDRSRLAAVFENLVRNAVQLSPAETMVEIEANPIERDGTRWVECTIADRGPGFVDVDLARVFEPFYTQRRGGTGLGLSIVQRVVEEHHGTVTAANRDGGGALMSVRLPAEVA